MRKLHVILPVAALCTGALFAAETAPQGTPNAIRLSKYILTVSNLEQTYAFYHALGINLDGATELKQPQKGAAANRTTGAPADSSFRNANMKIPGADFTFEAIELTGLERTPQHPRIQDPGASMLYLRVRDVDAALAAVKKQGATVVTPGGAPMHNDAIKQRAVLVSDPDGFFVMIGQPDEIPAGSPEGLVIWAQWGTVVQDAEKSAKFYHDNFGLDMVPVTPFRAGTFATIAGTPKAQYRTSKIHVPGTSLDWTFYEFGDIDRKPIHFKVPDPGSLQLGFQVHDADAAVAAFRSAGGAVVSQGGEITHRPNGGAGGLVRDPDGVYLEIAQPGAPAPAAQPK
jgi:predicted enzyme related to lactoylglutathione lyase